MFVGNVVGEFELVEGDWFGHPLLPGGRTVRVDVHALGHLRVCFPRHHPARVVKFIATVIRRYDVHQQDVLGLLIQAVHAHFIRRKHSPARREHILLNPNQNVNKLKK